MIDNDRLIPPDQQDYQAQTRALVTNRFERSMTGTEAFFTAEAGNIARACRLMATRFHQGGRLLAFGSGAAASDAQHVAVEFVHPVTVGKRALPALALEGERWPVAGDNLEGLSPAARNTFAGRLALLARPHDIAIGFSCEPQEAMGREVAEGLSQAHRMGLLTLAFTGKSSAAWLKEKAGVDFSFMVPEDDPWIVQETHRTVYHILWELVHVYFEHEGLLEA